MWFDQFGSWLLQCTLCGAVILSIGGLAVLLCRQPVYRIGIVRWTFLGCLLVPVIRQCDLLPNVQLAIWPAPADGQLVQPGEPLPVDAPRRPNIDSTTTFGPDEVASDVTIDESRAELLTSAESPARSAVPFSVRTAETPPAVLLPWLVFGCKTAYAAVLCGVGCVWTIGFVQRRRIARTAAQADGDLRDVLYSIAGDARSRRVRLLVSDKIDAPIMWGVWRPTIIVPTRLAADPKSPPLRYGLAHEWSHVCRADFAAYVLANAAKLVCFHQPVYWWLRKQLILSQDYLADAFAARQAEMAEDYADYLVSLARTRSPSFAGTLGVRDRRSRLLQRVQMLIGNGTPLLPQQRRWPALMIHITTAVLVMTLGAVRLGAQAGDEQAPPGPASPSEEVDEAEPTLPDPITYTGRVVDHETEEPIVGAVVQIARSLSRDPVTHKWLPLETTEHVSDATGNYSFTLPPEQVAQPSLILEVDAHHPNYQPKGRSGYAHSMILKNFENGEPPFYSTIKLFPGEPVFATVLEPDGTPAANARVTAYTKAPSAEPGISFQRGAFQRTTTDDRGLFQIVCATPGDGVVWVYPEQYSPVAIRIRDKRGDLGPIRLMDGHRVSGQVLSAKGEPVPSVGVAMRRNGDGEEADEFLGQNAVVNGIRASTKTDAEGRFQFSPLPPGTYRATIEERVHTPGSAGERPEELEVNDVFAPLEVTITAGTMPEPLEIRAVPHVLVRGRFFNSQGEPRASHQQHIFGRMNGQWVFAQSTVPGKDGWFEFKLPHGVEDVEVDFMTNEHSALRWRLRPDQPLQHGYRARLGKLEEDFTTLEVIRYTAPILLLKAIDDQGNQLRDFVPDSRYTTRSATENPGRISGAQGEIGFESQPDGRWRSSQLLPDEDVTVTLKKEGYTCEPQSVSLQEGDTRELTFVLKRAASEVSSEQEESAADPR